MWNNTIGFLGIEKYDIIIYLAKLISNTGKKVLIIDNSETDALGCCIAVPEGLDPHKAVVSQGEIDYVKKQNPENYIKKYDFIITDYGFNVDNQDIKMCQYVFLVLDKQFHNRKKMQEARKHLRDNEPYLLIRDVSPSSQPKSVLEEDFNVREKFILEFDAVDRKKMVELQYNRKIGLNKLSYQYKELLERITTGIFNIDKKEYFKSFKKLKRGA